MCAWLAATRRTPSLAATGGEPSSSGTRHKNICVRTSARVLAGSSLGGGHTGGRPDTGAGTAGTQSSGGGRGGGPTRPHRVDHDTRTCCVQVTWTQGRIS